MNKKLLFASYLCALPLYAGTMGGVAMEAPNPWFASVGAGYSYTNKPGIDNPNPARWDFAAQGYNGPLSNQGFYTFTVGKQVHQYVDVSLSYLNHENFDYQWFQSGVSPTPGFTGGERTRYLTLNNRSLMANVILHCNQPYTNLINLNISPFVSGGIGAARNRISNFYTVGNSSGTGSVDSIGRPLGKTVFAWQGSAGLNFQPTDSHLSTNIGYRYYDGGRFTGPSVVYSNANGWTDGTPWTGHLTANQVFLELKYTV